MEETSYAVGLMSGTSIDGIDAALVKIGESENGMLSMDLVEFLTKAYPDAVREKIETCCDVKTADVEQISAMNMLLGKWFGAAALEVLEQAGLRTEDVLLIASHGQTIFHQPTPVEIGGEKVTSTLQIGDISVIAEHTGVMTVGDFRPRDMATGGEGAPLVPYADYMLFKEKDFGRVLVNIGGIANITVIPDGSGEEAVTAYDTGPGNMIIDTFVSFATNGERAYDENGDMARQGTIHDEWIERLMQHGYFEQEAPKSTGREMFGEQYASELWKEADVYGLSTVDKIATVTELTARTISEEIGKHITSGAVEEILVSGGGRFNSTLLERLQSHLPKAVKVMPTDEVGMPADAKEAMIFALLGYQCWHKRPNNLPAATGADKPVVMGKIAW